MTRTQYLKIVEKELTRLNERIDQKIICGLGYGSEACRHKRLVGLTRELKNRNFMSRVMGFVGHAHAR